jgi:hypothetical protein
MKETPRPSGTTEIREPVWTLPTGTQQEMEARFKRLQNARDAREAKQIFIDAVEKAWYNE